MVRMLGVKVIALFRWKECSASDADGAEVIKIMSRPFLSGTLNHFNCGNQIVTGQLRLYYPDNLQH